MQGLSDDMCPLLSSFYLASEITGETRVTESCIIKQQLFIHLLLSFTTVDTLEQQTEDATRHEGETCSDSGVPQVTHVVPGIEIIVFWCVVECRVVSECVGYCSVVRYV